MTTWNGSPGLPGLLSGQIPQAGTDWLAILDALHALSDAWTAYTPTWTASTNPAIGNGTFDCAYILVNKFLVISGTIYAGSTTTFGSGAWAIGYPVAINNNSWTNGVVMCYDNDSSASQRPAAIRSSNANNFNAASTTGWVDATDPFTWATSDELHFLLCTQAA